jgi:hypothetical protein
LGKDGVEEDLMDARAQQRRKTSGPPTLVILLALMIPLLFTLTAPGVSLAAEATGEVVTERFAVDSGDGDGYVRVPTGQGPLCDSLSVGSALLELSSDQVLAGRRNETASIAGFRIEVDIPSEATILEARLMLWNATSGIIRRDEPLLFTVNVVKPGSGAPFTDAHTPLHPYCYDPTNGTSLLGASALWELAGGGAYTSPDLRSLLEAHRSAPSWQPGSVVELLLWPTGASNRSIKVYSYEGDPAQAASLTVTYQLPDPDPEPDPGSAHPELSGPVGIVGQAPAGSTDVDSQPWDQYGSWDVWRLRIHEITIIDDQENIGRGDISLAAAIRLDELDPAYPLCPDWVGTGCPREATSLVKWCWPPGTKVAKARVRDEIDAHLRQDRPLPFGVLGVYDPYLHTQCVEDGGTYQIGSGETLVFDPPLTTERLLLDHRVGDYDGIFDIIDYEIFDTAANPTSDILAELSGLNPSGEGHVLAGHYVVDFGAFRFDWIGRRGWGWTYAGNDGATARLSVGNLNDLTTAYVTYSFDIEEMAGFEVAWGLYVDGITLNEEVDTLRFSSVLGGQGWRFSSDTRSWNNTSLIKQAPAVLANSVDAPGYRCIPVNVSVDQIGSFNSECLEPGTYTIQTGQNGVTRSVLGLEPGFPHATFTLVKFAVGVPAPLCFPSCGESQSNLLVGEFGSPRWALISTGLIVIVAIGGLVAAMALRRRRWLGAAAGVAIGIATVTILTLGPKVESEPGAGELVVFEPPVASQEQPSPVVPVALTSAAIDPLSTTTTVIRTTTWTTVPVTTTPTVVRTTTSTMVADTTTSTQADTTTSTVVDTTTTVADTTTTVVDTTTTVTKPPVDTSPPEVTFIEDVPDPVFTGGTTRITARVSDQSAISAVELWQLGGKGWVKYGDMTLVRDEYRIDYGPLAVAGVYEWRIRAVDALGNATCSTRDIDTCPGDTTTAIIP